MHQRNFIITITFALLLGLNQYCTAICIYEIDRCAQESEIQFLHQAQQNAADCLDELSATLTNGLLSVSSIPIQVDPFDLNNYSSSTDEQKFWTDTDVLGQTFSIDYNGNLKSITLRTSSSCLPTKSYLVRIAK